MNAISYIEENKDRFLNELLELLKIPSISADKKFAGDVRKAAEYLKVQFEKLDTHVEICETDGYPIVYAEHIKDPDLPPG